MVERSGGQGADATSICSSRRQADRLSAQSGRDFTTYAWGAHLSWLPVTLREARSATSSRALITCLCTLPLAAGATAISGAPAVTSQGCNVFFVTQADSRE
jgi:hypothetical protein